MNKNIIKTIIFIIFIALVWLGISMTNNNQNNTNNNGASDAQGMVAKAGDTVTVHYTGKLEDGTVFDSSVEKGIPFSFLLGSGQVIQGWEQGIAGMAVGEQKQLVIPPELGYGDMGVPGVIPAGATLIFDVELLAIN